jgi:hypothetical protein
MISQYEVIGKEKVRYRAIIPAGSVEEATQKFLKILQDGDRQHYDRLVSGITIEVNPTIEEG